MAPPADIILKIFPPLGIARLGNSPDAYFIGPEAPGVLPDFGRSFKDDAGRVKRQAARFRIYGVATDGSITAYSLDHPDVASIEWTVTLANKKATWHTFDGARAVANILRDGADKTPLRNAAVPAADRHRLEIVPGPTSIGGRATAPKDIVGEFTVGGGSPQSVQLGTLRTDEHGNLLVLGGLGRSQTPMPENPLTHYANNDGWYDDTSDGSVNARLLFKDGVSRTVDVGSWVICVPPSFAPAVRNPVTLRDVMLEAAIKYDLSWSEVEFGARPTDDVSFTRDIYPVLVALDSLQWVSKRVQRGHAPGKRGSYMSPESLKLLATASEARKPQSVHKKVFAMLRHPLATPPDDGPGTRWPVLDSKDIEARRQATLAYMPALAGDEGDVGHEQPETWFTLTPRQYAMFKKWKDGEFIEDWSGPPKQTPFEGLAVAAQPAALTFAALEATQGGAFFPGIELTSIVLHRQFYDDAFRVAKGSQPGDLTRWMALPWQADFYECRDHWWPAARPDDVLPTSEFEHIIEEFSKDAAREPIADLVIARRPWARGVGLGIAPRPGFPPAENGMTPAAYKSFLDGKVREYAVRFTGFIPRQQPNEPDEVLRQRIREFLAKSVLSEVPLVLPERPAGIDNPEYRRRIRRAVIDYLITAMTIRAPQADEGLTEYQAAVLTDLGGNAVANGMRDVLWRSSQRNWAKNDLVDKWSRLGFVVPRSLPRLGDSSAATVQVEIDRGLYDLLEFREYFYYLMNIESYPQFLPKARELADEYFRRAHEEVVPQLDVDGLRHYQYFNYDPVTFESRLEKIYEMERRSAEASRPGLGQGPEQLFNSPARIVERIRQLAPFNQLDGSWLERVTKSGPINDVQSFLFEIWSDEIGAGDPAQNHANVYTDLLRSAGIYLPPLNSRAYAFHPQLWAGSFSSPVYQSAAALFPEAYYPELLGMTLYLEWEAVYLPAIVKLYEYHGFSSLFYRLHVAIDNPLEGHGAKARDAVVRYLNDVRANAGEREMQEHWRRIWTGYLAFKFVGDSEWEYRFANPPMLDEQIVAMVEAKRQYAQLNHGDRRFAGNRLNDWFDEPGDFLGALAASDLIVPGDAARSPFFDTMKPTGVMLKVFTPTERQLLADWVNSLPPLPAGVLSPPDAMKGLLELVAPRATSTDGHDGERLKGRYLDPASNIEREAEQSIAWWFSLRQPERLMAALAAPENGWIVAGQPDKSRFVIEFLNKHRPMLQILSRSFPALNGKTGSRVIVEWIADGCQLPGIPADHHALRARLSMISGRQQSRPARATTSVGTEDDYAQEVTLRTVFGHRFTDQERTALRRRRLGPGGGAAH